MRIESNAMRLGFHIYSQAWYSKGHSVCNNPDVLDEIMLGDYPESGGQEGEFCIRWINVGCSRPCIHVECFSDSFELLVKINPIMLKFYEEFYDTDPTVDEVAEFLKRHGFIDLTKRTKE